MYQQVDTDKIVIMKNGEGATPIATLADEHGGRTQIAWDDGCYVVMNRGLDGRYVIVKHIYGEKQSENHGSCTRG